MQSVTLPQINERLNLLPPEKLVVVYDFVSYLGERELRLALKDKPSEAYQTILASEQVLDREWNTPEEDEAWVDL